ncbi:MAG: hypothetical protein Q8P59_03495, partial [Dehalococcoidia bacterium]|nr:hypothetical protein [Dehalococcoidia bacterium]
LVILFNPLSKMSKRPLWWLLIVYISYSLAVTSGWYAYGTYGFRYALIMAPLFTLAAAAVIEQLVRWKQPIAALALLAVIAVLGVYSLPNRTLSQLTRGALAWPETEDMGGITQYWIAHRSNDEPTYVYYGAVPAFRYYLRLYGVDKDPLPPAWYTACWEQEKKEVCARDGVFYGEWLRTRSAEEKVLSIQETLGQYPPRLWLVFSHTYPGEDQLILQGLLKQYHVAASNEQVGASAYLLERFETGGASP